MVVLDLRSLAQVANLVNILRYTKVQRGTVIATVPLYLGVRITFAGCRPTRMLAQLVSKTSV